jgi:uncharacterized membrane protein YeiB
MGNRDRRGRRAPPRPRDYGVWQPEGASPFAAGALHTLTGYAGGLGYAALIGLVAAHLWTHRGSVVGPIITALAACGQRSMTFYLLQSVAWLLLYEPYLADLLGRAGLPGPAEALLRRLTYRGVRS